MKTRNALFALCLPLAFAACQNEELADLGNQSTALKNRGVVDVTIAATRPSADTRMSSEWEGTTLKFLWEKGIDKLGAALMDEVTSGTVTGNNVYVNNPFIAQNDGASAEFKSPSSLTKGIYLFYNQYQDVLDRGALKLVLGEQKFDPASSKSAEQQAASYMKMIAPMVDLSEGIGLSAAESFKLPLQFVNLYTPIKVPVLFKNAPEGTKLTKITISSTVKSGPGFNLGGAINPVVLAGGAAKTNVLTLADGAIDEEEGVAVADAIEALDAIVQKGVAADGIYSIENPATGAAVLTIEGGVELKNDEAKEFWVLIPRGTYGALYICAETSNGNMTDEARVINAPTDPSDPNNPQIFTSSYRKMANVVVDFNDNVSQPTDFTINSSEDWTKYTQYVMDHVTSYIGRDITFTIPNEKSIYVTSLPQFGFKLTTQGKGKLVLGKEDKSSVAITADLSGVKMTGDGTIVEIGKGATVTVTKEAKYVDGVTTFVLTNNGTLKLNAATAATINNYGTMAINADATMATLANKGTATVNADVEITSLTNKVGSTRGTVVVSTGKTLTVGGTNNGTIQVAAGAVLTNLNGFTNSYLIDNFGELQVVNTFTNDGTVRAENGSCSNNVALAGDGVIQVMNPTTYTSLASTKVYLKGTNRETAVVTNRKTYNDAAGMTITLGGGEWNVVPDPAEGVTLSETGRDLMKGDITTDLILAASLRVKTTAVLSARTFTVSGNATITTEKDVTLTIKGLSVDEDVTATIAAGSKVLLPAGALDNAITVNGTLINNGILGVTGNDNTLTAATSAEGNGKKQILVNAGASLVNKGIIGGEMNTCMNVNVLGSMDNSEGYLYGTPDVSASEYWKKGVERTYAGLTLNVTGGNYSAISAKEIVAKETAVVAIPAATPVTIEIASGALVLAASTSYGAITFKAASTISAEGTGTTVSSVTVDNVTLTVGGQNKFKCISAYKKGTGSIAEGNAKMTKSDGTTYWTTALMTTVN